MIEKTSSYKTKDGQVYATLPEAQVHELELLGISIGGELLKSADAVIAILKLKPRKAKAVKKAPTPKAKAT